MFYIKETIYIQYITRLFFAINLYIIFLVTTLLI